MNRYTRAAATLHNHKCPDCAGKLAKCDEGETARCGDCGEEFDIIRLTEAGAHKADRLRELGVVVLFA